MHGVALDVHAEDRGGLGLRVVRPVGDLDAAGLAAAAGLDLGLDDDPRRPGGGELLRDGAGFRRCLGDLACGDGNPVLGEELFRLMLKQVH